VPAISGVQALSLSATLNPQVPVHVQGSSSTQCRLAVVAPF
jgi:hypothetical protein